MKKTLLAMLIPALTATSAHAAEIYKSDIGAVDFYGQLRTQLQMSDSDDVTLSAGSSRTGVKANYTVNDSLSVFGKVEFGLAGNGGDLENRLHIAGVDTDYGKLSFGRQWVSGDDVYGADYSYFFGAAALFYDDINGARHSSLIKYNLDKENFWVAATVGLDEDDSEQSLYEVFAGTTVADVNLHAGFGVTEDSVAGSDYEGLENQFFEVTAEYTFGDAFVGFSYNNGVLSQLDGDMEITSHGYSLAGIYSLTEKLALYSGLELVTLDLTNIEGNPDDFTNFYLGAEYQINDFSKVYAEYGFADGDTLGFENSDSGMTTALGTSDQDHQAAVGYRVYW